MFRKFAMAAGMMICVSVVVKSHAQYSPNVLQESSIAIQQAQNQPVPTFDTMPVPHLTPRLVNAGYLNYLGGFTFVIAHRGLHTAPFCAENSACSIAAAYEAGADGVEFDIKTTADAAPVLGHDQTTGRELASWNNQPVPDNFTPFSYFPILDYTYLDLTKYPFLNNYTNNVDENNPPRSNLQLSDIQNSLLKDTYDIAGTLDQQLTLFEALYIVGNYYPMSVWLDVKNAGDLADTATTLAAVQQQSWTYQSAMGAINLKLNYATVKAVGGNPGAYLATYAGGPIPSIQYFLVIGTGDFDAMASDTKFNQSPPTDAASETAQVMNTINGYCTPANGCLGVELAHKYPNAPTQAIYNALSGAKLQLAGFHTIPQYSWYWKTLTGNTGYGGTISAQKQQALTYGRTFPRTDGSCCFALTDALNISTYLGNDNEDLRALYSWNESQFTTITTDEPLLVLRDLYAQGKRSSSVVQQLGGNSAYPSGGSASDVGPIPDGIYMLVPDSNPSEALGAQIIQDEPQLVLDNQASDPTINSSDMWYLSNRAGQAYSLTSLSVGSSIGATFGTNPSLGMGLATSDAYLWGLSTYGSPYHASLFAAKGGGNIQISNNSLVISSGTGALWTLTPVITPSSEKAQQQAGPSGYTYCADGDVQPAQTCSLTGSASFAYGANGSFTYLQGTGSQACVLGSFNGVDPTPGIVKSCFYAPYDALAALPNVFSQVAQDYGSFSLSSNSAVAYGVTNGNGAQYIYKSLSPGNYSCVPSTFGYDPAPYVQKHCFVASYGSVPSPTNLPSGYAYCATDGGDCVFTGTAAVAYGANGTYTFKTFTNGIHCWPDSFGLDPAPNVQKSCFVYNSPPLLSSTPVSLSNYPGWGACGSQGQTCNGSDLVVAYGGPYNGAYSWTYVTPFNFSYTCSAAGLGTYDPTMGEGGGANGCFITGTSAPSWVNLAPPGFTLCAFGAQACAFNGVAEVAYGTNGHYITMMYTTPANTQNYFQCSMNFIHQNVNGNLQDPAPGHAEACFYRLY